VRSLFAAASVPPPPPCRRRSPDAPTRRRSPAADASGWIFRFVKAMRDEQGEMVPNAHLVGFFRRICRLLFHNIRPVFVFDGAAPALKRRTVVERRRRREQQEARLRLTAEKLLLNRVKQAALAAVQEARAGRGAGGGGGGGGGDAGASGSGAGPAGARPPPPAPAGDKEMALALAAADAADVAADADAAERGGRGGAGANEEEEEEEEEEDSADELDLELLLPEGGEVDAAVLATLPPSVQLEVTLRMRERRAAANRGALEARAGKPAAFSAFQLEQYLAGAGLRRQLDRLRGAARDGAAAGGADGAPAPRRIAAEAGREYILAAEPTAEGAAAAAAAAAAEAAREAEDAARRRGEKALEITFTVDPDASDGSEEWEDVGAADGAGAGAGGAGGPPAGATAEEADHWRARAARRQRFWSMSHGFQLGRKLGDWEAGDAPAARLTDGAGNGGGGGDVPAGGEDAQLQEAIRRSLADAPAAEEEDAWEDVATAMDAAAPAGPPRAQAPPPPTAASAAAPPHVAEAAAEPAAQEFVAREALRRAAPAPAPAAPAPKPAALAAAPAPAAASPARPPPPAAEPAPPPAPPLEEPSAPEEAAFAEAAAEEVLKAAEEELEELEELEEEEAEEEPAAMDVAEELEEEEVAEQASDSEPPELVPDAAGPYAAATEDWPDPAAPSSPPRRPSSPAAAATAPSLDAAAYGAALRAEEEALRAAARAGAAGAAAPAARMAAECQELLALFGLPFLVAPAEAEAQAAALDAAGLVDGVVTDDNDAFLFGARRVYRNIFEGQRYVEEYRADELAAELGLSRERLVALALLLGSDYTPGVAGVGVVNALEAVRAFPSGGGDGGAEGDGAAAAAADAGDDDDGLGGLRRFAAWATGVDEELFALAGGGGAAAASAAEAEFRRRHRAVRRSWALPPGFPSAEVAAAYARPRVDASRARLGWGRPDLELLRVFCAERLGWPAARADELLLPVAAAFDARQSQATLDSFLSFRQRFAKFRSRRLAAAVAGIAGAPAAALTLGADEGAAPAAKPRKTRAPRGRGKKRAAEGEEEGAAGEEAAPSQPPQQPSQAPSAGAPFEEEADPRWALPEGDVFVAAPRRSRAGRARAAGAPPPAE
jgi:DNA excision repair protein ERCC-5